MKVLTILFILHHFSSLVKSGGHPSSDLNCTTLESAKFTKYSESEPICLVFHNGPLNNQSFFYFTSEVDEFTLISLVDSQLNDDTTWPSDSTSYMQMEAGDWTSEKIVILVSGSLYVVPQLTTVIVLDGGKVSEIIWDKGCYSCSGDACIDKNCGIKASECTTDSELCDLKIFVSWYGTDSDGDFLLSAGMRLSQFTSESASSYYNYVKNNAKGVSV